MNKKLIIGIIAGVVALAVIITAAVLVIKSFPDKNDGGESSNPTTSDISTSSDNGSSSDTTAPQVGGTVDAGSLGIKDISAKVGDTVKIPVKISDNPGIFAGQFYFEYDATALEYIDYEQSKLFSDYEVEGKDGVVACIISREVSDNDTKENGDIITLVFDVKKDAKAGDYTIKIGDKTLICNLDEQIITPKIESGKITVK